MKITKLGHCCLVIEVTTSVSADGATRPNDDSVGRASFTKEDSVVRIMTDPGAWSTRQNEEKNIDYIFITHEHQDHFHIESLKTVLRNNPKARIITNTGVGKLLDAEHIPYALLEHGGAGDFGGVSVEGFGEKHAVIYREFGLVQNTGYFFQSRFFYPGDAFYDPKKPVEILALPVCGPWMRISDAIDYAKALKPKVAFPVHDGMLKFIGPFHGVPQKILTEAGIDFRPANEGTVLEF